jgi:3-oxoadipate enol-lactonase
MLIESLTARPQACHAGQMSSLDARGTVSRDIDDWPVAWREAGDERAPCVVLFHGLGGSRISWEPQLSGLSDDYRLLAWDLPGYGASAPLDAPMTFDALADAAARWIASACPDATPVHVVGISFGGMIAQYLAARHPRVVRSLALMATSPRFGLDGTRPDEWRAARLAPLDQGQQPVDFADRVLGALAGPHISADAFDGQRKAMARISADALRRSIDCLITHDSRALLPTIAAPTLCLVGDLDHETPADYAFAVTDGIAGAQLAVIPDAGHLLNVEAPAEVNALLRRHWQAGQQ